MLMLLLMLNLLLLLVLLLLLSFICSSTVGVVLITVGYHRISSLTLLKKRKELNANAAAVENDAG